MARFAWFLIWQPLKHDKRGQTEQNSGCSLSSSYPRQWAFGYCVSEGSALENGSGTLPGTLPKLSRHALTMSEALRRDFQASPDAFHSLCLCRFRLFVHW